MVSQNPLSKLKPSALKPSPAPSAPILQQQILFWFFKVLYLGQNVPWHGNLHTKSS